jgi:dihydrofolate reductase
MRKVVVSQFVSLDGVFEDPGGSEDFKHGAWSFKFNRGDDGEKFKLDEVLASDVLLLGRITYEGFAAAWPSMKDDAGFAEKFNGMPKYVVSTTLENPEWNNSTVLEGDLTEGVEKIKSEGDGDILVNGSGKLVEALAERDLVDEYRLMVFPVVIGSGRRLFGESDEVTALRLTDSTTVGDGVLILTYEPANR